ncbi:MAG: 1-acyl-sn-glycerol-3-phosphate acyltransferase [Candidatus Lokiarchaeota archaeon]|nr:1-acyl-sn-glycerol-3-phosphate acyltransferase [Candidatus Lokiarchaeota archaeon]
MVIEKTILDKIEKEIEEKSIAEHEEEEQVVSHEIQWKKPHQNFLYNLLKYNPIDPLNDFYHKIIEHFGLVEKEQRLQWWAANIWVKQAARLMWRYDATYEDGELFPDYGGGIVVSNHESHLDPFFTGCACNSKINYMSKDDNFKTPIVRTLFKNLSAFSLGERGNKESVEKAWAYAKKKIQEGEWIGLFPEGTRSMDGEMGDFKTGAVRLAAECGVPIVPMAILGSKYALPKGNLIGTPVQVRVRVGKAIYYDEYKGKLTPKVAKQLTADLRLKILDLLEGRGNFSKIKRSFKEKKEELSIGSPKDKKKEEQKSKDFNYWMKYYQHYILQSIDDAWITFMKVLDEFGLKDVLHELAWRFNHIIVNFLTDHFFPYQSFGYENVPDTGPAIICSNHNSEWDVILNAKCIIKDKNRILWQMAKQELFQIPIVNAWIRTHSAFPLKRGEGDRESYNFARDLLRKGNLVMIYPEGTSSRGGGELLEPHTGAIRLAIETKVPIIPVGITGTENTFPKYSKVLYCGKGATFQAGKPFMEHAQYFDKPIPDYKELKRLTNSLMERIKDLLVYNNPNI